MSTVSPELRALALPSVADLSGLVGERGEPRWAKFPVNEAMIGLWCDAVGDENPAYQDVAWARRSRWGGLIAPASSLNMWTLPGYRREHPPGEPLDVVTQTLNAAGFTSVAAVNNEHVYARPLRPGDRLSQVQYLAQVSGEKSTALGRGHFFDIVSDFVTETGETVGSAMMRIFKWAPGTGRAASAPREPAPDDTVSSPDLPPAPGAASGSTLRVDQVRAGTGLPQLRVPLSATRIIALAAATLDYNDVHFEPKAALRAGARDIYMNILGSSGILNRYLTDWAGPEVGVGAMKVVLLGQNHPGDVVHYTGRVCRIRHLERGATAAEVDLEVEAANARGPHLRAAVTLQLPH